MIAERLETEGRVQRGEDQILNGSLARDHVPVVERPEQPSHRLVVRGMEVTEERPVVAVEAEAADVRKRGQRDDRDQEERVGE